MVQIILNRVQQYVVVDNTWIFDILSTYDIVYIYSRYVVCVEYMHPLPMAHGDDLLSKTALKGWSSPR